MPPSHRPSVSVVIPVHNEADYLPSAIERLFAELRTVDADVSVLVAENGSTDGSADVVRSLGGRYPQLHVLELPTPDYGAAMRAGFLAADGEWVVNFDIDYFSGDFLATAIATDVADVVLASKRAPGSDDRRAVVRKVATWGFNILLRTLLSSSASDTHGMKAIRRSVVQAIAPDVVATQDLFDTELVIRAERAGYRIVEVPVVVQEQRVSKSSLLRRVPRTLRGVLRMRSSLGR
jgi:glycosyltransferase involved in cell wall biosynthesis